MEENRKRKPVVTIEVSSNEGEEEHIDDSANKKRKKTRCGESSRTRADSRNCHQCKRNDKDRVVCCSRCKTKRFCIRCITRWYPAMQEETFLEACAVCRDICNCIDCLRLNGRVKHLMNVEVKFSKEEKLDFSEFILRSLLPALEQISLEQMVEKQIENQIQAFPNSDAIVHKAEYEEDKRIYCNNCSAFIVDFHRSCSSCSYKLCLTCCKELRNGNLPADASSEVRVQYIDSGEGCSTTSAKNRTFAGTTEVETRDQTEVAMAYNWKPKENGAIPCPPKDMGGCSEGILGLRCLFSENWILELLQKAKGIAQKCNLKEICVDPKSDGKLCKAAARGNSEDNYIYCPAAADAQHANSRRFRLSLSKGEPVIVTDIHKNALGLSWEPMVMSRACRQTKKSTEVLNSLNWCKAEMNIHEFFKGYTEVCFDSHGWPQLLQLPPFGLFDERLPRHGAEFSCCLPFKEYTHPQYGYLNLSVRLPDNYAKPDLGPKAYISYGFPKELGRGDSVTKLHYAVTDMVHVLMHTQAVVPKGMNISQEKQKRDSSSLLWPDKPPGFEEATGSALWDVFRRQDVPKLEEFLRKHFREFRDIYGSPLTQVVHPIFDETFYLSTEHKWRLKKEYGIESWTFLQKLGEAVFVPAGCPYQVRNLESCINVAVDFISPENVNECIRLTEELRKLPRNHVAREDKLGVKKIIVHAMSQAVDRLEKTLLPGISKEVTLSFQNIENIAAKKAVQDTSNVVKGQMHCIVGGEDIFHERDTKRQKKLHCGPSEMSLESHGQILQRCPSSEIVATSNCNLEYKICESPPVVQPKAVVDQHPLEGSVCAFCHSPKTTEKTGPLLYFANGREVVGNVTSLSKIIRVHSKCIEWTPQVYYEGDIIKNLDTELARAAKLKCSSCGVKGAALGCYVTSCRGSYHVPCAFEIQDCRWDMENFMMLCPIHRSVKFPSEKSKSRRKIRREVHPQTSPLTTGQSTFWERSSNGPKEWVLCGSALSSEEKYMLVKFADMCGATVCKFWKPNVTHVVAATDVKGACTRTMKVLMAILSGKWILTMDWVKACVAANGPVNEEFYEISLDNYGCSGGPKAGRLRASTNAPKLFDGFKFYLSGDFMPAYKSDLLDLVEKAGGTIIQSKEQLVKQRHAAAETQPPSLVVYNCDPPQGCTFEEESSILQQRSAEAEDLAKQIGFQIVQHTWILESIAACNLVPFF